MSPRPPSRPHLVTRPGGDPEPSLLPLDDGPGPARALPEAVAAGMVRAIVDAALAPERTAAPPR